MKKYYASVSALIALIAFAFVTPAAWEFYLWTTFPESAADRLRVIEANSDLGRGCSGKIFKTVKQADSETKACFLSAVKDQEILDERTAGAESITITYRCSAGETAGEIVYTFYSTTERYVCAYTVTGAQASIPRFKLGDMAGFSTQPRILTKLLIRSSQYVRTTLPR
ncbi:hypothetical protein [Frigidibacter oleivorans]|uniref:hypothetical protein n=1 Tax=Frigidibacter oleivorans TaxID=2487129 RepID=UPI000F8E77E5|nr:hypothetical protein [Frigidibacter oleivorans]